jgi:hypothetical protein
MGAKTVSFPEQEILPPGSKVSNDRLSTREEGENIDSAPTD